MGLGRVYYSPSFAYYVPSERSNLVFINDCTYYYSCYTFCDYHVNPYFFRTSCKHGCTVFKDTQRCDCNYNDAANYLYGDSFNKTECEIGCNYEMNRYFYPDYEVFDKSMGISEDRMRSYDNINTSLRDCNRDSLCHAVSFDENNIYYNQDSFNYIYSENSYFLVKRDLLGERDLDYMTTTQTSTQTSTLTTTATSTLTSTQTLTQTSSQTSTATSTLTSTLTSTATSTQTSTLTTTQTSTQTSTLTTTPTYYNCRNYYYWNEWH